MKETEAGSKGRQTIATFLRSEIERHARRISREENASLREAVTRYRHDIADLKRQMAALGRQTSGLRKAEAKRVAATPAAEAAPKRFSAKGLSTHRAKLGLSAEHYGKLIGTSGLSIYSWESGKAVPREAGRIALARVRGLGKREARRLLAELGIEVGARSGRRQRRTATKKTARRSA